MTASSVPWRAPLFFRAYRAVPHAVINASFAAVARREHPRFLVRAAIRKWIDAERIDMTQFRDEEHPTLERFFLRRLRDGARPIGRGLVSPVDGVVVAEGVIEGDAVLQVKGSPYRLSRLVNGRGLHDVALAPFEGGRFLTIFLSPRGYHYVHAPIAGRLHDARWIPGRFFPQNEDALRHIDRIYERNERVVLRLDDLLTVMVGASVVGGIHVRGVDALRRTTPHPLHRDVEKGEDLGFFTFGSTVVLVLPKGARAPRVHVGQEVRMGEPLVDVS